MNTFEQLQSEKHIGLGRHLYIEEHLVGEDCLPHGHNYFEIEFILSGEGIYSVNGKDYDIQKHNIFLLTPVDFHQIHVDKEIELINISFDEEILNDRLIISLSSKNVEKAYSFQDNNLTYFRNALELLKEEFRVDGRCKIQLCEFIIEFLLRNNKNADSYTSSTGSISGIKKALLYLEMHFKEEITLSVLAKQAGYHPTYFSELFHQTTGETYKERLNALRVRHARTLIKNGYTISNACYDSGFGSLSNFISIFKETYGMTPSQFKKGT